MPLRSDAEHFALIKVIGVGGGGSNAVNRMIRAEMMGVEFIAVNTDAQALLQSRRAPQDPHRRQADARPRRRRRSRRSASAPPRRTARRSTRRSRAPTWSSSPPAWAAAPAPARRRSSPRSPRDLGALTVGVVTKPFTFEGARRKLVAEKGSEALKDKVDTLITIPNDRLLEVVDKKTSHPRRLPRGRRRAAPGHAGHHRPDHRARPDQPGLRRRQDDHAATPARR